MADVQISVTEADVQIAVIDQENTQLALAAPNGNQVNIAVPGVQGPSGTVNAAADGTVTQPGISFASDTDVGLYRPAANTLGITAGGVLRMSIGSNRIRIPEINQLQITDSTTDAAGLQFIGSSSANSTIGTLSAQPLVFRTTSVERVRIDTSGRLGIGTSSPSQTLHVSGNALVAGTNQATLSVGSGGTLGPHSINVNGGGVSTNFGYQLDGTYRLYTNTNTGTNTNIASNSGNIIFLQSVGGSERARFDASGRLLVGTSAARTNFYNATVAPGKIQVEGLDYFDSGAAFTCSGNSSAEPILALAKARGGSIGSNVVVQNNDNLGSVVFLGSDGTEFVEAGNIKGQVDGTPGANDMPGRLIFSTTSDGSASPTERFRITNDGVRAYNQAAPAAVDATATLTVTNLKTGIITSTSAAATDMTLPTGTATEAGFSGIYSNMTFEWSVINTGPSLVRVLAGTAHTIVGSGSVATGTSGRFASRRTAANTFVTYRLS